MEVLTLYLEEYCSTNPIAVTDIKEAFEKRLENAPGFQTNVCNLEQKKMLLLGRFLSNPSMLTFLQKH